MINKDEFSMTKFGLRTSNSQNNLLSLDLRKNKTRNNMANKTFNKKDSQFKSLPKIKNYRFYNEKYLEKQKNRSNFNNSSSSTLLNFCDKKKQLSFYKGSNISVSSLFMDTNKTISSDMKNTSSNFTRIYNFKKMNRSNNSDFANNIIENDEKNNIKNIINEQKLDNDKSSVGPCLDLSQLIYKPTITSLRNRFSLLFNKEFEFYNQFIPSLYTLKFENIVKFNLSQMHSKILSCVKNLSNIFLDQDIENFKINEKNLHQILSNLLHMFTYNNRINQSLINNTKKVMIDINRDTQNKKENIDEDINNEINKLKKKLDIKNEALKQIKNEKFQEHNDHLINMKKLRDEQMELVKLLKINMDYFNKYQDTQKEIKEKNNIITQQRLDYKEMMEKNFLEIVKLQEETKELKEFVNPVQEENLSIKDKNHELESRLSIVDEVMKKKNQIVYRLQENLMMKEEELNYYIMSVDKLKEKNDKLSYDLISLKNKYQAINNKKYGFNEFDYNNDFNN